MINGKLPTGWDVVALGNAANNLDGTRVPLKMSDRKQRHGVFPYYGASGVIDHIDDFLFDGDHLLVAEDGANLLARSKPIAFLASGRFWVNNHAHVLSFNGRALLRYLQRYLCSIDISRYVSGSAQPKLNQKNLNRIEIPLPPLPEQKRIVDILDKADAVSLKRSMAIKHCESLTASLFHEMFSARILESRSNKLSDYLIELRYGTSSKSGDKGFPTLRIPNVVRGSIDLRNMKTVEVSATELEKLRLKDGDVLFVRTNGNPDNVGRSAIFDSSQMEAEGLDACNVIYASYLIRARLQLDRIRPIFLQSLLQSLAGRRNIREKCRTSAGQYNINTKGIGALKIADIPVEEQIEFERRVISLRPVLTRLETAHAVSENLFCSLVHRAFRGEL